MHRIDTRTVVVVTLLLGATVGAVALGGFGPFGSDSRAIEQVPDGVDVLVRVDGTAITDPKTLTLLSAVNENMTGAENETFAGLTGGSSAGPDPTSLDELLLFSRRGSDGYDGAVIHAGWRTGTVVALASNGTTYEETIHAGRTVHRPASPTGNATWVGVLDNGEYVLGTPSVVRDAIDTANGDQQGFNGTLRDRYDATRDGQIRFVATGSETPLTNVDRRMLRDNVTAVAGSYYTNTSTVGVELRLSAPSTTDARTVRDVARASISLTNATAKQENVSAALSTVTVERQGETVIVGLATNLPRARALLVYLDGRGAGPDTSLPTLSELGRNETRSR